MEDLKEPYQRMGAELQKPVQPHSAAAVPVGRQFVLSGCAGIFLSRV